MSSYLQTYLIGVQFSLYNLRTSLLQLTSTLQQTLNSNLPAVVRPAR